MKKFLIVILACAVLCAALAGCAPAAETPQESPQPTVELPDTTQQPDMTQPSEATQSPEQPALTPAESEQPATQQPAATSQQSGSEAAITKDEARQIMLDRVPGATAADVVSLHLERENGRLVYDGEIVFGGMEYEFEIDAQTGDILEMEVEAHPDRD